MNGKAAKALRKYTTLTGFSNKDSKKLYKKTPRPKKKVLLNQLGDMVETLELRNKK
jgi:hypothetical protein